MDPANGQVEHLLTDGQILPGSIAIYSCDVGLVPDTRSRFRECTADLTWSGIPPSCIQGKILINTVFFYFYFCYQVWTALLKVCLTSSLLDLLP